MVMLEPKYKHTSTDVFDLTNKALEIIEKVVMKLSPELK